MPCKSDGDRRSDLKAETALDPLPPPPEGMAPGDANGLDQFTAEADAGLARRDVFWIAGDPEGVEPVSAGQGQEQPNGSLGIVMATPGWIDVIAKVAVVAMDLLGISDAERDAANNAAGGRVGKARRGGNGGVLRQVHPEMIGWDKPQLRVRHLMPIRTGREHPMHLHAINPSHVRLQLASQWMGTCLNQCINIILVRRNQREFLIHQWTRIEKLKRIDLCHAKHVGTG